jgi:hypothetical protein
MYPNRCLVELPDPKIREANEQGGGERPCRAWRFRCCGVGGAKGGGQGERERAKHAPDTGSGARVTGARARTEGRKAEEGGEAHAHSPTATLAPDTNLSALMD